MSQEERTRGFAAFRDLMKEVKGAIYAIEHHVGSPTGSLIVSTANQQLAYAGMHLSRAAADPAETTFDYELREANNHCQRAIVAALEFGIRELIEAFNAMKPCMIPWTP